MLMAKKKATAPKKAAATSGGAKPTALTIRGSAEWREWLEEGAQHCLLDASKLVDIAVTQYLKSNGFQKPRPQR
jgi:hypothetical protein